jgi:purine-binding chemotaxis protein CheW
MSIQLFVLCRIGDAEYALAAASVVQMESFTGATAVPGVAPHVRGLVQIRGRVLPIIDLRVLFGLPSLSPTTLDARVVVVRAGERTVGLLVDSAREVLKLEESEFRPPPPVVAEQTDGLVEAVAQVGGRLLMLIHIANVIGEEGSHGEPRRAEVQV